MSTTPEFKITRLRHPPEGWPKDRECWRAVTVIQGHTFVAEGATKATAYSAMTRAVHTVTCAFQRGFQALLRDAPGE